MPLGNAHRGKETLGKEIFEGLIAGQMSERREGSKRLEGGFQSLSRERGVGGVY